MCKKHLTPVLQADAAELHKQAESLAAALLPRLEVKESLGVC